MHIQSIDHLTADHASRHRGLPRAAKSKQDAVRPLPGQGMKTGTSLSPEDIRRIVADMVG